MTSEERHVIAERMRIAEGMEYRGADMQWHRLVMCVIGCVPAYSKGVFATLAELVEPESERTCHLVPMNWNGEPPYRQDCWAVLDGMTIGCSECGYPIMAVMSVKPKYCPWCGAELVDG